MSVFIVFTCFLLLISIILQFSIILSIFLLRYMWKPKNVSAFKHKNPTTQFSFQSKKRKSIFYYLLSKFYHLACPIVFPLNKNPIRLNKIPYNKIPYPTKSRNPETLTNSATDVMMYIENRCCRWTADLLITAKSSR